MCTPGLQDSITFLSNAQTEVEIHEIDKERGIEAADIASELDVDQIAGRGGTRNNPPVCALLFRHRIAHIEPNSLVDHRGHDDRDLFSSRTVLPSAEHLCN